MNKLGKCRILGCNNFINWHWQLTIDNENPYVFMPLGCFYRSYTAINICNEHKDLIKQGNMVEFKYKGKSFIFNNGKIKERS